MHAATREPGRSSCSRSTSSTRTPCCVQSWLRSGKAGNKGFLYLSIWCSLLDKHNYLTLMTLLAIYGLRIYTALGPWNRDSFGPCWACWHRAVRQVPFGPKKVEISRAPPPSTCPSNGFVRIKSTGDFNGLYRTAPPPTSLYRPERCMASAVNLNRKTY